tara:strand:+ start:654 stop:1268 length:615 start_codon:yes stop_codon:yes gene_type:complete
MRTRGNAIYDILGIVYFGQVVPKNKEKISKKIDVALNYCHDRKPCQIVHKDKHHFLWASKQSDIKTVIHSKIALSVTFRIHKFTHNNKRKSGEVRRGDEINSEKFPIYSWLWDRNCNTCKMANTGLNILEKQYQTLRKEQDLWRKEKFHRDSLLEEKEIKSLDEVYKEIYKDIEIVSIEELQEKDLNRLKQINRGTYTDKIRKF